MNGEVKPIIKNRRSELFQPISSSKPQNLIWPANPSYDNPIVALKFTGSVDCNFQLKVGEKTNFRPSGSYKDYKIPENFKKVVVSFVSDTDTRLNGIEFLDRNGTKLLSVGTIKNPVETILDYDERLVGIASRNESDAEHRDF